MKKFLWAAAFVVCWSSGFVGSAFVDEDVPPAGLLAWRYLITAGLFVVLFLFLRPRLTLLEIGQQTILGILGHVLFLGGVFGAAAAGANAGVTALICALQPMLVAGAGRVFWKDSLRPGQVFGLALGIVAVVFSVSGDSLAGGAANLLAVVSLLGLSLNALLERKWRPETPIITALGVQTIASALIFTVVALVTDDLVIPVNAQLVGALVWLVLLSGLGGYGAYIVCLRRLGASSTSTLLYLTPPVTTLWAWAMFSQQPSIGEFLALLVGAAAVALILTSGRSHSSPPASATTQSDQIPAPTKTPHSGQRS